MKTKITKIEIIPAQIELNEPFVISKGPLTHSSITVVIIHLENGLFGTGECCPFRTIHGETQQGSVIAGKGLAQLCIGEDATEIRYIVKKLDKSLSGHASIKCAFDMALYDVNAKLVSLPLYKYLQGDRHKKIFTDMTVSLLEKEKMVAKSQKYAADGFPALKIKLGDRPSINDVERIKAIRQAIGDELPLRVDANQGWNYLEAFRALEGLQEYNIEHCEAPIPAGNFIDLRRLRDESPIPIMGDESVFNHHDAYYMLAESCIDLINIKLGKSGGISHATKIAGIAQAAGVYCQVGCFSETRLGISALAHFTMAWNNIIYYDMDSPLMQSEDPIIGGLQYQKDWEVVVSDEPGHGASYDPEFLNRFEALTVE